MRKFVQVFTCLSAYSKSNSSKFFFPEKKLLFTILFSLTISAIFAGTPVNGNTNFNSYNGWNDLTGVKSAGSAGLTASDVQGYDFTVYSNNNLVDCGIGIEPFTGQTPMVYGYSNNGLSLLTALKVSSNGLKYFDLNSVDISMDNGDLTARMVTLTGYKKGNPVPGATLSMVLGAASGGTLLTTYNVSGNSNFKEIDAFIITVSGSDIGAIGVDNINAVNFTNSPLPVTLVSFNGKKVADGTELAWTTANEKNVASFNIQRGDNNIFSTIAIVNAKNLANGSTYFYTDHSPVMSEINFYRLKMIDRDGNFTYSPILKIKSPANKKSYSLYPNPLTGQVLYLKIPANVSGDIRVVVSTVAGTVIEKRNIRVSELVNSQLPLQLTNLAAGLYQVQITELHTGNNSVLQFVK